MSRTATVSRDDTLHVRDHCLCLHTQRAARVLARRFDEAFRPLKLTSGQFSLLMSLNRPEAPALGQVAALLGMDRTTLSAALKPLERRKLLIVSIDAEDRRTRRLMLTRSGLTLLARALPIWLEMHAGLDASLRDPDRLRADLRVLAES